MTAATLVYENHPSHYPTSNLYGIGEPDDDGRYEQYRLVTVKTISGLAMLAQVQGIPVSLSHAPVGVDVFLSDDRGMVIDYDGDPANGLTPILSTNPRSFAMAIDPSLRTHDDALEALGYTLDRQES